MLWKRLYFEWPHEQLKTWAERAGPDILLELHHARRPSPGEDQLLNRDYICALLQRIESINTVTETEISSLFDYIAEGNKICFSSLKRLTVKNFGADFQFTKLFDALFRDPNQLRCACAVEPTLSTHAAVPFLRSISLTSIDHGLDTRLLKCTTHLSLSKCHTINFEMKGFYDMLQEATALEYLSLEGNGQKRNDLRGLLGQRAHLFTMPYLRKLDLGRENRRFYIKGILSNMDAPRLTTLSLWSPSYDVKAQSELSEALSRFVSLTTLDFHD